MKRERTILVDERRAISSYQGKLRLDFRKTFLMVERVKYCNRFSVDNMDLQSWKSFRTNETKICEIGHN